VLLVVISRSKLGVGKISLKKYSCLLHVLAHIPKNMLEKIKIKCFSLFWTWKRENEGIPLIKWKIIARKKEDGGLALKRICIFG
jgi:hypothetical protein